MPEDAARRKRRRREGPGYPANRHRIWDDAEDCSFGGLRPELGFDIVII